MARNFANAAELITRGVDYDDDHAVHDFVKSVGSLSKTTTDTDQEYSVRNEKEMALLSLLLVCFFDSQRLHNNMHACMRVYYFVHGATLGILYPRPLPSLSPSPPSGRNLM